MEQPIASPQGAPASSRTSETGRGQASATGGSIEEISREPRVDPPRPDARAGADTNAGSMARTASRAKSTGAPESELARRIRLMYLISPRSEYMLLAQPQRVAFRDMGRRIVTEHDDPAIIRGMLDVAQHKGWERIQLTGSETFRRMAWLDARARGLETFGYVPTLEDRQRLKDWLAERDPSVGYRKFAPGANPEVSAPDRAERRPAGSETPPHVREAPASATKKPPAAQVAVEERDAVVLAVADEVLRKRQVGEATRARVAAAIARRLAHLREQGATAIVRTYDPRERPTDPRSVELAKSRAEPTRSR